MRVLNIEVADARLRQWAGWFAPDLQPFFLTDEQVDMWGLGPVEPVQRIDPQERDTYEVYGVSRQLVTVRLDEESFLALPRAIRAELVRTQVRHGRGAVPTVRAWSAVLGSRIREQADGHRFTWWPSLLRHDRCGILARVVSCDALPDQVDAVEESTWVALGDCLPEARRLSGTFPDGSGPNCFGTVMAAAGISGAAEVWMQRKPFEDWLAAQTVPGGRDGVPGTVLVWRAKDTSVQHAAVTLGDGWVLQKPSQSWMSPREVVSVADVVRTCRTVGWRLHRYSLRRGT